MNHMSDLILTPSSQLLLCKQHGNGQQTQQQLIPQPLYCKQHN